MRALTCERAQVEDGMSILDLGCGWRSLTFWLAERYPSASVLAVSNSRLQRDAIEGEAARRGRSGVRALVADANDFAPGRRFDRVAFHPGLLAGATTAFSAAANQQQRWLALPGR